MAGSMSLLLLLLQVIGQPEKRANRLNGKRHQLNRTPVASTELAILRLCPPTRIQEGMERLTVSMVVVLTRSVTSGVPVT